MQQIQDTNQREYIIKLLNSNRKNDKPIDGMGVISFNDMQNFSVLNDKQIRDIDELRKVLFLVAVD